VFLVLLKLFAFLSKRPMVGNCVAPSRFRRQCAEPCRTAASMRSSSDKGNIGFGGHRVGDRVAVGGEHAAFERRAILATSPHQPYAAKMGSRARSERALGAAFDKGGACLLQRRVRCEPDFLDPRWCRCTLSAVATTSDAALADNAVEGRRALGWVISRRAPMTSIFRPTIELRQSLFA
jgi:hypothetical protein